jgi:hypothetical protein
MNCRIIPFLSIFQLRWIIFKPIHEKGMYITHFSAPLIICLISFYVNEIGSVVKELENIVYLFPNMFDVEHHQSVLPKYEDENCPLSSPKMYA